VTYVFVLVTFDFARTDFGSAVHFNCTSTVNVNTKYDGLPAGTRADCAAQTHSSKVWLTAPSLACIGMSARHLGTVGLTTSQSVHFMF
jgi:hypothetical protein